MKAQTPGPQRGTGKICVICVITMHTDELHIRRLFFMCAVVPAKHKRDLICAWDTTTVVYCLSGNFHARFIFAQK